MYTYAKRASVVIAIVAAFFWWREVRHSFDEQAIVNEQMVHRYEELAVKLHVQCIEDQRLYSRIADLGLKDKDLDDAITRHRQQCNADFADLRRMTWNNQDRLGKAIEIVERVNKAHIKFLGE